MLRIAAALVLFAHVTAMPVEAAQAGAQAATASQLAAAARRVLADGEVRDIEPPVARLMGLSDDPADLEVHQTGEFETGLTRFLIVHPRRDSKQLDILLMRIDLTTDEIIYCATSESATLQKAVRIAANVARLLPIDAGERVFDEELTFWLTRLRTVTDAQALNAPWKGQWTSPDGSVFSAVLQLKAMQGNRVEGRITWTLVLSLDPAEQPKIGVATAELVRGTYDQRSRVLSVDGYDKEDPNNIIALDRYRLIMAVDRSALAGPTWNHGSWSGTLSLRRQPTP